MHIFFVWSSIGEYIHEWPFVHFVNELEEQGHTFYLYNPAKEIGPHFKLEEVHDSLLSHLKKAQEKKPFDLFFSLITDEMILPDTISEIKKQGIPTVNFSCDNIEVPHNLKKTAPYYDLNWIPEPEAIPLYKNTFQAKVFYSPMAANPLNFKPMPESSESINASFCGAKYGSREYYIAELARADIPFSIYGKGWTAEQNYNISPTSHFLKNLQSSLRHVWLSSTHHYGRVGLIASLKKALFPYTISDEIIKKIAAHCHGVISFEDMIGLYSKSKLTLGFNERGNTFVLEKPLLQIRLRDFEAPMSGACYLMYRIPEMLNYFEEDKEMLFYESLEELKDKIKFYSADAQSEVRNKIRIAALERATKEHTWTERFNKMLTHL